MRSRFRGKGLLVGPRMKRAFVPRFSVRQLCPSNTIRVREHSIYINYLCDLRTKRYYISLCSKSTTSYVLCSFATRGNSKASYVCLVRINKYFLCQLLDIIFRAELEWCCCQVVWQIRILRTNMFLFYIRIYLFCYLTHFIMINLCT